MRPAWETARDEQRDPRHTHEQERSAHAPETLRHRDDHGGNQQRDAETAQPIEIERARRAQTADANTIHENIGHVGRMREQPPRPMPR
jgi:hypothetical protein